MGVITTTTTSIMMRYPEAVLRERGSPFKISKAVAYFFVELMQIALDYHGPAQREEYYRTHVRIFMEQMGFLCMEEVTHNKHIYNRSAHKNRYDFGVLRTIVEFKRVLTGIEEDHVQQLQGYVRAINMFVTASCQKFCDDEAPYFGAKATPEWVDKLFWGMVVNWSRRRNVISVHIPGFTTRGHIEVPYDPKRKHVDLERLYQHAIRGDVVSPEQNITGSVGAPTVSRFFQPVNGAGDVVVGGGSSTAMTRSRRAAVVSGASVTSGGGSSVSEAGGSMPGTVVTSVAGSGGKVMRCTYEKCPNPDLSVDFYDIPYGKKSKPWCKQRDWSPVWGYTLCHCCYQAFCTMGKLERGASRVKRVQNVLTRKCAVQPQHATRRVTESIATQRKRKWRAAVRGMCEEAGGKKCAAEEAESIATQRKKKRREEAEAKKCAAEEAEEERRRREEAEKCAAEEAEKRVEEREAAEWARVRQYQHRAVKKAFGVSDVEFPGFVSAVEWEPRGAYYAFRTVYSNGASEVVDERALGGLLV